MILFSHPTGNENARQAALAFCEAQLLGEFWTTLSWDQHGFLHRLLPSAIRQSLARRSFPEPLRARTHTIPAREIARLLTGVLKVRLFSRHETGLLSIDQVSRELDRQVASRVRDLPHCNLVYAYEDCAFHSFQAAAARKVQCVYDLPIGHWRAGQKIFAEERDREPEWAGTLTGVQDSAEKLARKDGELRLADRVIVASNYTKETLSTASFDAPVDVIPYGAPAAVSEEPKATSGKLKVLFAGGLGQRKGLSYAIKAVEILGDAVEFTLLGRKAAPGCRPLEAAIRKYRWLPTLPHHAVLDEMSRHDLLLFPSLFEGFGLVILEAMAQGTPVIATPHTAGPDLIEDGVDGFIVPVRSPEAIAEKLELLVRDRERLVAIQSAARRKAQLFTWENYRHRLAQMAREVMAKGSAAS